MTFTAALASIAPRIGQLIRMLGSDKDGEVIATARALSRTLKSANADLHDLADTVETAINTPSAPMIERDPDWHKIAERLLAEGRLSPKEMQFAADMVRWRGRPTERQRAWLIALRSRELERAQ